MNVKSRLTRGRGSAALTVAVMVTAFVVPIAANIVNALPAGASTPAGPFTVDMTNREDVRQFFYRVHDSSNGVAPNWTGNIAGCNAGTVSQDYLDATATDQLLPRHGGRLLERDARPDRQRRSTADRVDDGRERSAEPRPAEYVDVLDADGPRRRGFCRTWRWAALAPTRSISSCSTTTCSGTAATCSTRAPT